ncbi:MAG: long-chain fatty acid--CoA ligase [Actinomycetota bacterium]|nr:long-chain fatty acid--CoA ligase [Actinomycetota bacterium]
MSVADLVRRAAHRSPEKVALAFGATSVEGRLSYAELDAEVDRVASGLVGLGVTKGDRVAIAMPNIPHFVYAYFGVLRAGAVAVPLNAMLTQGEISEILSDAAPRVVLGAAGPGEVAAKAASVAPGVEKILTVESWDELGPAEAFSQVSVADDDLAVLAYTSGTTGKPKGAMLSHGNLIANIEQQQSVPTDQVREDDVLLITLPLFHIFGLNVPLGLLVRNAATGVLLERFEPVSSLRTIEAEQVTILFGAPPMYVAWVTTPGADQYDLSSVRLAVSGAAPIPVSVIEAFGDMFAVEIDEGYGLTETAPTLTSNRMAPRPKRGTVGRPLPDVEMRIVDESGNDVEMGDPGEIVVKGPNVFQGYWQREEETEKVFRDGWFHTGDVAVQDEDGFIQLVDRMRDLVIVSGFNVYPSEVEAALLQNPKIKDAVVVGVPHEYRGETLKAYVVLSPGEEIGEDEIIAGVRARLARFKCPESVEIVEELPYLLSGKVSRRALRTEEQPPAESTPA